MFISPGFLNSISWIILSSPWNTVNSESGFTFYDSDHRATTTSSTYIHAQAFGPRSTGKWYWEVLETNYGNAFMTGYSPYGVISNTTFGAAPSFAYNPATRTAINNGCIAPYGPNGDAPGLSYGYNIVTMYAIDYEAGYVWLGTNGTWYNSGNPATGANPTWRFNPATLQGTPGAPSARALGNYGGGCNFTIRTKTEQLGYPAPSGFIPWSGL